MKSFGTKLWHFVLFGVLFGMCFPFIACAMGLGEAGESFSIEGVIALHHKSNLFYIIDLTPLLLGLLFFIIGKYSLVQLRYLKRLSIFERELRESEFVPLQKIALRKIRLHYVKTFVIIGFVLVFSMVVLLFHFNFANAASNDLAALSGQISEALQNGDAKDAPSSLAIEAYRQEVESLIEVQKNASERAIVIVAFVTLFMVTLFVFSHFKIFFPNFVDLQKGIFENTAARKMIGNQAEELKKHSFASANSGTAMCTLDEHGEVEWVNDVFQKSFVAEELKVSLPFLEQFEQRLVNAQISIELREALEQRKEYKGLVELLSDNSERTFFHMTIEPYSNDMGGFLGYFVLQNDVTELVVAQKVNDDLLRRLQQNLEAAKVIQKNLSERRDLIRDFFGESFVVNRPLQVLSGDYIWFRKLDENTALICLGDCVGHGVAGSLLANLYSQFLDEITEDELSPDKILIQLDQKMKSHMDSQSQKGLEYTCEAGLLKINKHSREVQFAGSNTELILNDGDVSMVKSERFGVGSSHFQEHPVLKTFQLKPDSWVILSSDGLKNMVNSNSQRLGRNGVAELLRDTLRP
ncbi:MAG: serine phosphatase RsbU (regulator of sigma subunit), partial [Flavobacteriales bacterium]